MWEKCGWASEEFQELGVGVGESEQVPKGGVQQVPKGGVQQAPAGEHAAGRPCVLACEPFGCGWTRARVWRRGSRRAWRSARAQPTRNAPTLAHERLCEQRLAHCSRPAAACALLAPSVRPRCAPRCRHTHTRTLGASRGGSWLQGPRSWVRRRQRASPPRPPPLPIPRPARSTSPARWTCRRACRERRQKCRSPVNQASLYV